MHSMKAYDLLVVLFVLFSTALARCGWNITCPCGTSNDMHTFCLDDVANDVTEPCNTWSKCATCRSDLNECLTCPEGTLGPTCDSKKYNVKVSRQRRHHQDCNDVNPPKSGSVDCLISRSQRQCTGKCIPGYVFSGQESVKEIRLNCQSGSWTPRSSFPDCKSAGYCDLEVVGGAYNCTSTMQGTNCDILCHAYSHEYSRYFCYPGNGWNPPLPACVTATGSVGGQSAPPATEPEDDYDYCRCNNGGVCDSQGNCICQPGYSGRSCDTANVAVTPTCADPGLVSRSTRLKGDGRTVSRNEVSSQGDSIQYTCISGYVMRGNGILTCTSSGTWSSALPRCERAPTPDRTVVCSDPGHVTNADRHNMSGGQPSRPQTYDEGESVVYTCHVGFTRTGPSVLTCLGTGQWSSRVPTCQPIPEPPPSPPNRRDPVADTADSSTYCPDPGTDPNGRRYLADSIGDQISQDRFSRGAELVFSCIAGYTLQGPESLTCRSAGRWSASRPTCRPSGRSPEASDVALSFKENDMGSEEDDYSDPDYAVTYCQSPGTFSNGHWTVVSSVEDNIGRRNSNEEEYPERTRLLFTCNQGYALVGSPTLHCQQDGFWSQDTPFCTVDCGRSSLQIQQRVFRGVQTVPGEWPWTVGVANISGGYTTLSCGGSLLDTRTVLTAAHCLMDPRLERTSNIRLYFGKFYRSDSRDDDKVVRRRPTRFIIYPQYDTVTMNNDIALIQFEPPLQFSDRIQPVCLPTAKTSAVNLVPDNKGYVLGWGTTERNLPSPELLMAYVPVVPGPECLAAYRDQNLEMPITETMFCAGFREGRTGSCAGDSGGPLVFRDNVTDRHMVEGIVSFGSRRECGRPERYTVFTQVSRYLDWIADSRVL